MILDPIEQMMLRRLADFFADNANYESYNIQDWYHRSKFWNNIAKMAGMEKSVSADMLLPDSYHYDPPAAVFDLLKEVYLTSPQRFNEMIKITLKKMNLNTVAESTDNYDNKKLATIIDEDKISSLNRYLSVFNLIVDNRGRISSSTGMAGARTEDRKMILDFLEAYPDEKASFVGAMEAFAAGGEDAFRQSLSSCRALIENLIKKLSSESQWTIGLAKVIEGETKMRLVKSLHSYLSGYGIHDEKIPSQSDAELGLKLSEDMVVWIIKSYRSKLSP